MSTEIQETINRLRELDRVASPAPWDITHSNSLETSDDGGKIIGDAEGGVIAEADVDLWSHSFFIDDALPLMVKLRNALPVLLEEIDRLTDENTQLLDTAAEAWDEGYQDKETEAPEEMIERGLRKRAQNPYRENKGTRQ